jgi:RNA polymerase sigma-70 factor, ECF subfamily
MMKPETNFSTSRVYFQKGDEEGEAIARVLAGDTTAFATLVEKYQSVVYNVALRFVQDRDEAEDVAQSVFVKVYENLGSYDHRLRFFSWLYRISVNESLNHLRQRRPTESVTDQMSTADAQDDAERADTARLIKEAIQELSPDHKAVIVLRHYEELGYDEIAEALGISEKKVKSRLFTARQVLRGLLEKRGVKHDER